jgi:putative ABC transport system permease protein
MRSLRHIFRRFGRAPIFTSVALATLALGIGANTAIFSVVNAVLIKPLPYSAAQQLVGVWHLAPGVSGITGNINCSPTMYFTYREESRIFQDFGLWSNDGVTVTGAGEPEQVPALDVTYGTLQALGVQPEAGHWFSQADDTPGAPDTVLLTYGYWQRHFSAKPASVIGRTLIIDSKPRAIIGVMPQNFRFLNSRADLILPEQFDRNKIFLGNFSYQGIARLKPGVTIQQANTDVARMLPIWLKAWPAAPGFSRTLFENARFAPKIEPLKREVVGDVGATLWVLMGTIGLVLVIACANVANLLLVRAESRQQELAIRAALGAGWGRIAREMLLESLTLGVLGGALGLALAYAALSMLVAQGPATLPRLTEIRIDPLALAFTVLVSLLAGLFFGLIPVIKYAGPRLSVTLRGGGRTMSQGRERHRARNVLVVAQVALALVLLIGSGLMIRTFQALRSVQPGFTHPEQVQLLRISIPDSQVKDPQRVMRIENEMIDRLAAIPGVASVGLASAAPLERINNQSDLLYAQDKTYSSGQIPPVRAFRYISPGFFKTDGTPLIAGRDFTWTDVYEMRHVAIVSENLARELWGSPTAALGKQVRTGLQNDAWREIVGVVSDVYDNGPEQKAPALAYWPAMLDHFELEALHATRYGVFAIRTNRAGNESFLAEARRAIWSVDANVPVFLTRTLKDIYDASIARTSFTLVLLAIAGVMALVLGVVGIYGVIAYAVTQRTREIGIRMALGAQPAALQHMFVRQGLLLGGIGALMGLGAAAALTRMMSSLLFKTTALDPLTYAVVSALLILAATLASYCPARRATAVSPIEALRTE